MMKYKNCLRCGSENTDLLSVNTRLALNYTEVKTSYGVTTQRIVQPTDALVCKDCGHIELIIDWDRR